MDAADAAENGTAAAATTPEAAPPAPAAAATSIEDTAAKAGGGAVVADAAVAAVAVAEPAKTAELPVADQITDSAVEDVDADKEKDDAAKKGEGKEDDPDKGKTVGTGKLLFKYATWMDILYMFLGTCSAIVCGLTTPNFILVFGDIMDELNGDDILSAVQGLSGVFAATGAVAFVSGTLMVVFWNMAGDAVSLRIKKEYVRAILKQDIGWFDEHPAGELPSAVASAMAKVQDGIGRKIADMVMNLTLFLATFIIAFDTLPKLAAVMLACFPFIALSTFMLVTVMAKATGQGANHYSKAGGVANEVIASIRTVASLTAEENEVARYSNHLDGAEIAGIKAGLTKGVGTAVLFASFFLGYALAFWYGTKLVADDIEADCTSDCATGGQVITTIFGVLIGAMGLGQMAPGATALGQAKQAGYRVFQTLERVPPIDASSPDGSKPEKVEGRLEFKEVGFSYPTRPDDKVLGSVSLSVAPGETVALVGPSGGGKSTLTKLLLRFYDPTSGSLLLDGHDVKSLNVQYYRSKIGYVGQEPVLFSGSIRDNIAHGKPGATDEEIIAATKAANAHEFIKAFPDAYATDVGTGGLQLSGGQKQRIAIARAIIKDPAILLLDEATSALDSESEKVVQQALDRLHKIHQRTTVVIAHRLSTIQDADRIAVVANQGISELGTHSELMALDGIYASLCAFQGAGGGGNGPAATAAAGDDGARLERQKSASVDLKMRRQSSSAAMHKDGAGEGGEEVDKKKKKGEEDDEDKYPLPPSSRMWALNKAEAGYLVLGFIGALMAGSLFPVEGVLIANMQNNLYATDPDKVREVGEKWSLGFVGLAAVAIVGHTAMAYGFSVAGERLTRRLREVGFKSILRHDVGWFDKDENSVGVLTTRLEEDASKVQLATGTNVANKTQLIVTVCLGVVIGMISAWQIGLLALALIPMMASASFVQMQMMNGTYGDTEGLDGGAKAGVILGGALNGVTTMTAFNLQEHTSAEYDKAVTKTIEGRQKRGIVGALAFGYSQGMMFWVFAVIFYVGAILVDDGTITFLQFFQAFFAVFLGAFGVGQIQTEVGAANAARHAAGRIFRLEDDELLIDPLGEGGAKGPSKGCSVQFRGIKFAYPQRPDAQVYGSEKFPEGFALDVGAGETVALVGPSGSGKSTCIQLLLRFYDPAAGSVALDGRDIKEINVQWLRSQMGYVGQEPVLFTGTITENIARGKPGASKSEIEKAAKSAFAHDFITSFADGYETDVGEKSALLSGGQKQRIAIARAIINDPPILLLDEATSALDNESERQVQAALDNLQSQKRRTTLVVAHRLTTVRNADRIAVISQGGVCELGSHEELMAKNGSIYGKLYRQQTENRGLGLGDFVVLDGQGSELRLSEFNSCPAVLIVNVASHCSSTDRNYLELQALRDNHGEDELVILAFPCNQFGGQEPGGWEEISSFAQSRFGVTFPILGKVDVNGLRSDPLFAWLKAASGVPGDISWNFTKFLVVGGYNVTRFSHEVNPSQLEPAINHAPTVAAGYRGDL
eukprot:g8189.t1